MTPEEQLSKIQLFQNEIRVLSARFRAFHAEAEENTYLIKVLSGLADASFFLFKARDHVDKP